MVLQMAFGGYIFYVGILCILGVMGTTALRKVLVREISFSVSPSDLHLHVTAKNDVVNDATIAGAKISQGATITGDGERKEKKTELLHDNIVHSSEYPNIEVDNQTGPRFQTTNPYAHSPAKRRQLNQANYKTGEKRDYNDSYEGGVNNLTVTGEANVNRTMAKDETKTDNIKGLYKDGGGSMLKIVGGDTAWPPEIAGGVFSSRVSWTWQASIQYLGADDYWHHFCGGSLIHSQWVVTAAHCVNKLEEYTIRVVLGDYKLSIFSNREQVIHPARIFMHGYYEETSYYYDVAMVQLSHSADTTSYVRVIEMASPHDDNINGSHLCYIAGWGSITGSTERTYMPDYLQESRMSLISKHDCRQVYGNIIVDAQVCIQSETASACSGDSGGPLVCDVGNKWLLVGIASWVRSETCSPQYPNVYTRMSTFGDWAASVMHQY